MIDIKVIKKPKNEGSTSALRTGGTAYGGMAVKEAAHAAKAEIAELAKEATHAKESDHTLEADHAKEADHATNADEAKHAIEADHAKEADNADQWDYREFDDYLDQPVRKEDGVAFDSVTSDSIRSAGQFVDGLLGAGFQLWKDEQERTRLTLDKLTVRQTMSVMELLIEKVRSVGGQICVSAANGKIKTVEEQGDYYLITFEQENMFVQHDMVRCQTFTGKDMRSYWVEVADTSTDGIVVAKTEFETSQPMEGDECVLMGNTENTDRQNLVLISATEDGQPRVDVMDGVKGKTFDGCLRARLGNLDGIRDDRFPAKNQPKGNGLYADNAYLKGTFVLETGEDVKTRFEITEGKVQSALAGVRNDFLSEKGYLNNPTFASGLEKWSSENETVFFLVGNRWVWANSNVLSKKGDGASVTTDMGRKVVRIRNKYIVQKHGNLRYVPTFPTNGEGQKEALPVYLSFFYRCAKAGTLKIGFENVDKTGFADFDSMAVCEEISTTEGYVQYTCNGAWNGTGDFKLAFDGDIYLYMLVLSTDKIEALTYKYKTLLEQSETLVRIAAENFDKDGKVLEGSEIITTSKYNTLISERFDEHGYLKNTAGLVTATDWEAWLATYGADMEKKLDIAAFAGMFATAVEENTDIVKRAEVSAFVTKNGDGRLESGVKISADQITLDGTVTMNEYFKVNADGSLDVRFARMKDAEVTGVIHANLLYSSTKVNAPNKYQIDPAAEPCNMFFWEYDAIEGSWDATEAPYSHWIYLPDATVYDGLELSFFWDRPLGKTLKYLYVSAINGQKIIFEDSPYYLMKTSDGNTIDVRRFGGCSKSDSRIYCLWNTYTTLKAIAGNWYIIAGATNEE
ncbi:MAG TPA: hypothetical protein DC006_04295 [Prevotellaceae bacterium]|nr:hypothetical protein [Prevotellaceae bacterium]